MNNQLIISNTLIPVDHYNRVNLNALHKASGLGKHKAPNKWLSNVSTKELILELNSDLSLGKIEQTPNSGSALEVNNGGSNRGTFAHELLAISYAGWISPKFQLEVNRIFLAVKRASTKQTAKALPQHTPHPYFDTDVAFSNVNHTKALAIKDPCIEMGSTIATCSLTVARIFNRPHDEIIDLIRNLKCSTDFKYSNFSAELIGDITSGQFVFYITKDGLTFLMMDLNLGADIKEGYIREFNVKKRAQLYGHPTPDNTRFLAPLGQVGDQLAKY
ncbi:KilA-N domain-containing protein [Pseudoalteromonas sp. S558]|uniref:KilA-N domain-containing protein n=1 Tax=Pseudoalteromonas sp. S558 TaxID=2066515 RepID=UPI00110BB6B8|nr:KilA-N domain-containing protein [Pseudoalteromonas sp. S558]TMO02909.1 hypothetical protein CWB66_12290 [Pseudoalteromonas sp. S558]